MSVSGAASVRRVSGAVTSLTTHRGESLLRAWASLERARQEARDEAVDAAFAIAERVIGEVARRDRGAVLRALDDAMALHGEVPAVLVRAHEDDVAACREALAGGPFAFVVAADAGVARGGVVVESVRGVVDARVEVRVARLRALVGGGA